MFIILGSFSGAKFLFNVFYIKSCTFNTAVVIVAL